MMAAAGFLFALVFLLATSRDPDSPGAPGIAGKGGALALSGGQVLGIKDEAKRLLSETPGLQLPNDLLLYAKTLSYLFALCERLEPDADVMKLSVPYLLKFLAHRD